MKFIMLLMTAIWLTACSTLELSTALALTRLEPADVDPKNGRIAVLWPAAITEHIPPVITAKASKNDVTQIDVHFALETDPASEKYIAIPPERRADNLIVYKIAESDLAQANQAQRVMEDYKATSGLFSKADWDMTQLVELTFSVTPDAYAAHCNGTAPLDITIWVKTDNQTPFKRLVNQQDLDKVIYGQLNGGCNAPDGALPEFVRIEPT